MPAYEALRLDRADRQRAMGAGRDFDQSLALRTIALLAYLRLHMPQLVGALLFGLTPADISRDLHLNPISLALTSYPGGGTMKARNRTDVR